MSLHTARRLSCATTRTHLPVPEGRSENLICEPPFQAWLATTIASREDYVTPVATAEVPPRASASSPIAVIADGRHLRPLEHPERIATELASLRIAHTK